MARCRSRGVTALLGGKRTQVAYVAAIGFHIAPLSFGSGLYLWSVPVRAALVTLLRANGAHPRAERELRLVLDGGVEEQPERVDRRRHDLLLPRPGHRGVRRDIPSDGLEPLLAQQSAEDVAGPAPPSRGNQISGGCGFQLTTRRPAWREAYLSGDSLSGSRCTAVSDGLTAPAGRPIAEQQCGVGGEEPQPEQHDRGKRV